LTAPLLALPLLIASFRSRAFANWPCAAAVVLFLFTFNCRVQIGIRLVLPLIAITVIGLSVAVARAVRESRGWRRHLAVTVGGMATVGTAIAALSIWPHVLCYTNELWGGSECGYLRLSDSNYDWGQGLKDLAQWQRLHDTPVIDVWYFGTDPAIHGPGFRELPIHALPIRDQNQLCAHLHGRYLAVGTTVLFGSYCNNPSQKELLDSLRKRRPLARAGTFLIFDLQPELAARNEAGMIGQAGEQ